MKAAALLSASLLVMAGCGDGDDKKTAAPETVTITTPAAAPAPKAKPKADPAERQNKIFLALDDDAVALDTAIGLALDGDSGAVATLGRIRERILDHNLQWAKVSGEAINPQIAQLSGAATDAKVAAEAGDQRALVKARVAGQRARESVAGFFLKRKP